MTYWLFGLAPLVCWPLLLPLPSCLLQSCAAVQAFFGSLGHIGAFPCSLRRKFSSFLPLGVSCLHTHTLHTHTPTDAHLFYSLPEHPTLNPPRPRQLDLPPHAATPNASLCTGAHAAAARVELLRSLREVVSSSSSVSTLPPSKPASTAMSVTTRDGQREGFLRGRSTGIKQADPSSRTTTI